MVFLGSRSRSGSTNSGSQTPTSLLQCSRLTAFRQLAASLQPSEEQKGFNPAACFGAFGQGVGHGDSEITTPSPCDVQVVDPEGNITLNFSSSCLTADAASPVKQQTCQRKQLAKALPRLLIPGQSAQSDTVSATCAVTTAPNATTTSPLKAPSNGVQQARVIEIKGKARQHALAKLQDAHLSLFQEGESKPYRVENMQFSTVTEQSGGVVLIEGPFCVLTKIQFESTTVMQEWVQSLLVAAKSSEAQPTNVVEKSGTLVKVKDTIFGNRSVVARLMDHHLHLYSGATSQTPYRVEHLLGASIRMADTCFFLEGPFCLPGIYKLGDTNQTLEWVTAIQQAISAADPASVSAVPAAAQDEVAFHSQLAQQLQTMQDMAAAAPASKRADVLGLLAKCQAQLTAEFGGQPMPSRKPEASFCRAPGGPRKPMY